jgi:hypothetical protein
MLCIASHNSSYDVTTMITASHYTFVYNRTVRLSIADTPGSEPHSAAADSVQQAQGNNIRPAIATFVECFKHMLRGEHVASNRCQLYKELKSAESIAVVICAAPHFSSTYMQLNSDFGDVISRLPDRVAPLTAAKSSFKTDSFKSDSFKPDSYGSDSYRLERLDEGSPTVAASEYAALQARHSALINALQCQLADKTAEISVLQQDKLALQQSVTQLTAQLNASEQKCSELVVENSGLTQENSDMCTMQQQSASDLQRQTTATLAKAARKQVELERHITTLQADATAAADVATAAAQLAAAREAELSRQIDELTAAAEKAAAREAQLHQQMNELTAAAAAAETAANMAAATATATVATEQVSLHYCMCTLAACWWLARVVCRLLWTV